MPQVTTDMMEQASRNLCALRQLDPDFEVTIQVPPTPEPDGTIPATHQTVKIKQWQLLREEILTALQIQQAVATGFEGRDVQGRPLKPRLIVPH